MYNLYKSWLHGYMVTLFFKERAWGEGSFVDSSTASRSPFPTREGLFPRQQLLTPNSSLLTPNLYFTTAFKYATINPSTNKRWCNMKENKIHVAYGFHVNCYHSYRGDTNDNLGFGSDIRIIN